REALENAWEDTLEHLAILQYIRDTRGHAQVVFEDVVLAVAVADQVGAGNVAPDSERRIETVALLAEGDGGGDHVRRDGAILEDLLLVINVVNEAVERVNALLEAAIDVVPLGSADDARDQVEGK